MRSILDETSAGAADVVVVDNGSTDGSLERLSAALPKARVFAAPGNVGYARGANLGIAATDAPVVAVLNGDVELKPGVAAAMIAALDADPRLGAVGPRVLNLDGSVYPSARTDPGLLVAAAHAALGLVWRTNPWTRRYRQLDVDPTRRATSTGSRARRCGCGARRSTTSADGTSATSCTWRTSTCACGCAARAGASSSNRRVRSCTCRARARRSGRTE